MAKGLSAASLATFVALFGHVAGGGSFPGPFGLVASLVLSGAVCVLIAGRALSLLRLSISVAVSQVLFHFLFVLGSSSTHVLHAHHGHGVVVDSGAAHGATSMSIGHLVAGVVTVLALFYGERVLRSLAELVLLLTHRMLRAATIAVVPASEPRPAAPMHWHVRIARSLLDAASVAPRRGPPVLAV